MAVTIVLAKPKPISATASSRATTLKRSDVKGPFALYWFITIIVWAGAVAAAIAPSKIDSLKSTLHIINVTVRSITAPMASKIATIMGALPTFLK